MTTGGTLVFFRPLGGLAVYIEEVHVKAGLVREDVSTVMAQVAVLAGVEQAALHVGQLEAVRTLCHTGQLPFRVHTDVFGCFVLIHGRLATAQALMCCSKPLPL